MKPIRETHKGSDQKESPPNPSVGRNANEVWKELYARSKPISREEVMRRYQQRESDQ